jgi:hypothetical protein
MMLPARYLRLSLLTVALACLAGALAGCGYRDEIKRYTVPKPVLVDPTLVSQSAGPSAASKQQMLGAIIFVKDRGWFFKLVGDPEAVEPQREAFISFVKSVRFSSSQEPQPTWSLPAGWKELPGSQFRFVTIQLPASGDAKPLEIAVSSAGGDVLSNVNRWRGQVGLEPIASDELAKTTETFKVGDYDCTFVSLVGAGSGGMTTNAPFAQIGGGGATPRAVGDKRPTSSDLAYEVPREWGPGKPSQFSVAAFAVTDGDQRVDITITSAGGDLLSNINRWRGQLMLSPISAAELAAQIKKIDVLGGQGDYIEIAGPDSAPKRETILGVIAASGGRTWFIRLKGDSELAAQEKPRFEAFVKSIKVKK